MKERLSLKITVFEKVLLAILLFFLLSLPTPVGILECVLIRSEYSLVNILQRLGHFAILFYIINKILKDSFFLEYDADTLYINDKGVQTIVLLKHVDSLKLKPKYLEFNRQSYKFELNYFNESGVLTKVTFFAYAGKILHQFVERVEKQNGDFEFKNWTFN
jgi:hypothetical protein